MRKLLSCIVFVLIALFSISPIAAQEPIVLKVWGEPGTGCSDPSNRWEFCFYSRALVDSFEAAHPGIELEFEDHGWDADLYADLQAAIADGTAPDITLGESFFPQMVRDGQLLPIELEESVRANLMPATVAYVTDGDALYGVSIFTGIFALEINTDVFYAAGLTPEAVDLSSWDSVLEVATEITDAGGGSFYGFSILGPTNLPGAALFRVAPYLYQVGADLCNMPDCDTVTFDDPRAVPVYQWLRDLYQVSPSELVFNGDEGYVFGQLFAGYTAMQTAGSWHVSWSRGSGCGDCRYLPLPLPEGGHESNTVVGNAIYVGLATTEHPDEVRMFLEWLTRDEIQNAVFWTGVGGRLPTTYSAIENIRSVMRGEALENIPSFYVDELGQSFEGAPLVAREYGIFIDELLNSEVRTLPFVTVEISTLWNEMFREILISNEPIEDILAAYQLRAEELVATQATGQ
jgi:ABC-type glycerol-3-phosphate transport system substrate-binding protein